MELVEADGEIERGSAGVPVLAGDILEQALGGDGQLAHPALEEVAGERRLGRQR